MMRDTIWLRVVRNVPSGHLLPRWALVVRAVLYPLDFMFWHLNKARGYDPATDTWLIYGVRYSGRALLRLAQAQGETYRVTRSGDVITFERVCDK